MKPPEIKRTVVIRLKGRGTSSTENGVLANYLLDGIFRE